jgi:bifunctional non-homologous end joining protein LigD
LAKESKLKRAVDPLHSYKSKRNFALTPEPKETEALSSDYLTFVVQKHWASNLHYDLRLELNGTMKSWAIPKGPSLDPTVKRMAVQVEDHPLSYANFEGTVPAKLYGAGKVIVWDTGAWSPIQEPVRGYREGHLKFELHGHKLRGKWVLVRMKGQDEKQAVWLLIKEKDSFARPTQEYNVVEALPDSVKQKASKPPFTSDLTLPAQAIPCVLPPSLAPQLATLSDAAPRDASEWSFEVKFDGYRILVRNDRLGGRFFTRSGLNWTAKLVSLKSDFDQMKLPQGWYDGEIVLPNEAGLPDFGGLQQAFESKLTDPVLLYLFDLPYVLGHDLRDAPLETRRNLLQQLLSKATSERVRFSENFEAPPESLLVSACKLGLEGIIAKRRTSPYRSARSQDWIKLKCAQRQEFVIAGYTAAKGARSEFGALLLGVHDERGVLQYAGKVGTGFNQHSLHVIQKDLKRLARSTSPFSMPIRIDGPVEWVTPTLVAEVSFAEWTRLGRIRHAVFRSLRANQSANNVGREKTQLPLSRIASESSDSSHSSGLLKKLRVTNSERIVDASTGTTKIELVQYYALVGDLMMMHLKGRPVSLVRAPQGIQGQLFFQKHTETDKLPGIRQMNSVLEAGQAAMLEVKSKQGLLSAAQWNVVEFHTSNNRTGSLERPDRMVFDLDPGQGVAWEQVIEGAQLMHAMLTQLALASFVKTSGGKGLHIVVPLRRLYDWETVKGFSRAIVQHMAKTIPQRFVALSGPKNRVRKIFIDYLRNGRGASTVSAWSARARPGLGISVPVAWAELPMLRGGDHWCVQTVHERISALNDPWNGYAKANHSLSSAMSVLGWSPPTK